MYIYNRVFAASLFRQLKKLKNVPRNGNSD